MNTTFQNSAQVLLIGIFFSLMIVGPSSSLPQSLYLGLVAHGVSPAVATRVSQLPPVSTLFAAFLGYNPVQHLVGPGVFDSLDRRLAGDPDRPKLFLTLITAPFKGGLHVTFDFAIAASLVAAAVSLTRGGKVAIRCAAGEPCCCPGRRRRRRGRRRRRTVRRRGFGGDRRTTRKRAATQAKPVLWRIGEVAKLTGVTTRALRYWRRSGFSGRPAAPTAASASTPRPTCAG